MADAFEVVRHSCGAVLCDALMTGVVRVKCPRCDQRVWIVSDGTRVRLSLVDSAPDRVSQSASPSERASERAGR
jgi:phage FluMu protein Com